MKHFCVVALTLAFGMTACSDGTNADNHATAGLDAENNTYLNTVTGPALGVPLYVYQLSPEPGTLCLIGNGVKKAATACFNAEGAAGSGQPKKIMEISGPDIGVPLNVYKYSPPEAPDQICLITNGVGKASIDCW